MRIKDKDKRMKKFSFSCPVRASVLLFEFFLRHQVGDILSRACVLACEMAVILQIGDFNSQSYVIALHDTSCLKHETESSQSDEQE